MNYTPQTPLNNVIIACWQHTIQSNKSTLRFNQNLRPKSPKTHKTSLELPPITPHPQIHIVVQVHSSTPILAEAYSDETAAMDHAEELKADINPEYDEIDVFSTPLK